jgi:hypothetical protein
MHFGEIKRKKVIHQIQVILQKKAYPNLVKFKIESPNPIKTFIKNKTNKIKARMYFGEIKNKSKFK